MTTHVLVLAVALAVTALLNWWSVARGDLMTERITKPSFMLLLIGLAWSLHAEDRAGDAPPLTPVLVALGLSLLGDLALLHATERRFLLGLGAFLLAHVAYVWAVVAMTPAAAGPSVSWWLLAAIPFVLVMHGRFGRDVVRWSGRQKGAVFLYEVALVVLLLTAAWRGDPVVLLGCALFLVSDTILGHDRFVLERRWAPVQVMVTYHLAQALLVAGLLR